MKLVVKIGGSISISENGPIHEYFEKLLPFLDKLNRENQLIVCIGGGKFLRKYYESIRSFGLTDDQMEWIAIDLLKVNVRFLAFLLNMTPIYSLHELNEKSTGVIGGITPGRSTDANAAAAASIIKADLFIKLTDVDGIYDSDPKKYHEARLIKSIPFSELSRYAEDGKPGHYGILDKLAIDTISRNQIKTILINGSNPENIFRVIKGEKLGTIIHH